MNDISPRKGAYLPVAIRQTLFKAKVSYDTPLIVHDNAFESLRASLIHMAIEY